MVKRLLEAGHTGYRLQSDQIESAVALGCRHEMGLTHPAPSPACRHNSFDGNQHAGTAGCYERRRWHSGGLGAGKIYIDMSTVSPAASRELAQQVETKGAQMLDAPVSGSVSTLEEGKLSIMVGGGERPSSGLNRFSKPSGRKLPM